jgi:uncharacterized repeat protein (TIGR03803 family)
LVPNSTPFFDGKLYLYGTAAGGQGAVYQVESVTGTTKVLWDPDIPYSLSRANIGTQPQGVLYRNGVVYGTAFSGGAGGLGTVFQLSGKSGKVLHAFTGPDGAYPLTPPIIDASGTLYGTTWEGGNPKSCPDSPGCGTVWKRAPFSNVKVLHSFAFFTNKEDGQTPLSPLLLDEATGTLYGTTFYGGTGTRCGGVNGSCGTVFQVGVDGEDYKVLWEFPNKGPAAPQGQLALFHGDIYGTSYDGGKPCPDKHYIGCGTVWKLTP